MKKIYLSFIIFNILLSQCDNASKYVCQINPACEWFSEVEKGVCSDLEQSECQAGQYNYCYWSYGYGSQGECSGGNYIMRNEYCMDANNAINDFVDNVAIRALSTLLKASGFRQSSDNNFILDDNDTRFTISYNDINLTLFSVRGVFFLLFMRT